MTDTENHDITPLTKEELIKQISKTLFERRQARHVTLEAVSQRLKIRMPLLDALEKGRWEDLPGDVYIRGFVIRYAQYLGLDGDKLIEPYLGLAERHEAKGVGGPEASLGEGAKSGWLWFSLVIITSIVLIKFLKPAEKKVHPRLVDNSSVVESVNTSTAPVRVFQDSPIEEHALEVFSPYQLWLKVTTPVKVFEGFIPEGSTWAFRSEGQFQIKLGHTKEVLLKFDGRQVPLFERQKNLKLPSES